MIFVDFKKWGSSALVFKSIRATHEPKQVTTDAAEELKRRLQTNLPKAVLRDTRRDYNIIGIVRLLFSC